MYIKLPYNNPMAASSLVEGNPIKNVLLYVALNMIFKMVDIIVILYVYW